MIHQHIGSINVNDWYGNLTYTTHASTWVIPINRTQRTTLRLSIFPVEKTAPTANIERSLRNKSAHAHKRVHLNRNQREIHILRMCLLWIGRRARGLIFFPIYTLWHVDDIQSFHLHHVLNLCDLSMNVTSGNGCFIDRKWLLYLSHETNWRRQMMNIAPTVLLESIEFWLPIYFTINLCTSATKQTHALIAMWCVKWADLPFEHFNSFPITERMYEVGPLAFHHTLTLEWPAQRPTNNWDSIGCEREVDMLVE